MVKCTETMLSCKTTVIVLCGNNMDIYYKTTGILHVEKINIMLEIET